MRELDRHRPGTMDACRGGRAMQCAGFAWRRQLGPLPGSSRRHGAAAAQPMVLGSELFPSSSQEEAGMQAAAAAGQLIQAQHHCSPLIDLVHGVGDEGRHGGCHVLHGTDRHTAAAAQAASARGLHPASCSAGCLHIMHAAYTHHFNGHKQLHPLLKTHSAPGTA